MKYTLANFFDRKIQNLDSVCERWSESQEIEKVGESEGQRIKFTLDMIGGAVHNTHRIAIENYPFAPPASARPQGMGVFPTKKSFFFVLESSLEHFYVLCTIQAPFPNNKLNQGREKRYREKQLRVREQQEI